MSRKKKIHFFHWSVCTLYRPYHHFMNLKRKLAPPPPRWELVSPSCGNSNVAMSGDKVTSLRGVLSGGWHCVTTPDAGCFVIFLPDCYSDVFMNGLETKNWTHMTGSQQWWSHSDGFHRVKEGEKQNVALKSSPSEASVCRWDFFSFEHQYGALTFCSQHKYFSLVSIWSGIRPLSLFLPTCHQSAGWPLTASYSPPRRQSCGGTADASPSSFAPRLRDVFTHGEPEATPEP